jgi:hypothetical protein
MRLRAAVHDALATDRLRATDEMAVFGTHPYKRSSGLAKGFPDSVPGRRRPPLRNENCRPNAVAVGYLQVSHVEMQQSWLALLLFR